VEIPAPRCCEWKFETPPQLNSFLQAGTLQTRKTLTEWTKAVAVNGRKHLGLLAWIKVLSALEKE
jgi:hypothetical protein